MCMHKLSQPTDVNWEISSAVYETKGDNKITSPQIYHSHDCISHAHSLRGMAALESKINTLAGTVQTRYLRCTNALL